MRPADRVDAFRRAFEAPSGLHWVYDSRADAARVWIARGIRGLPAAPADAPLLLAEWIRACPAAKIRRARLELAADVAQSGGNYAQHLRTREDFEEVAIILADRGFYA